MSRKDCPAINMNCLNCGIKGHLESVCRQPHGRRNQDSSNNAKQVGETPNGTHMCFDMEKALVVTTGATYVHMKSSSNNMLQ